ncbi:hypothetical protein, partial [Neisseria sp. P0007.S010]|uniref:hypothetical protein n=1 Tax=Neisseria sp. P0007.S010 TaxID=3436697 RepID=UPI003F81171A
EGAHGKSPKCLGGNLGDFGEFCKGLRPSETPKCSDGLFLSLITDFILNIGNFPIFAYNTRLSESTL